MKIYILYTTDLEQEQRACLVTTHSLLAKDYIEDNPQKVSLVEIWEDDNRQNTFRVKGFLAHLNKISKYSVFDSMKSLEPNQN